MADKLCEGWGKPMLSRKWHYFESFYSICNRWMYSGELGPTSNHDCDDSKQDCAECCRRLKKRQEKANG